MDVSSEDEETKNQEELNNRKEQRQQRKLDATVRVTSAETRHDQDMSSSLTKQDRFRTYKKLPGAIDHGKEYEQMMCAFYALKLITCDRVEDFEMTTNNQKCGLFDDIEVKITFKNQKTLTYLFQLKHKEAAKQIRYNDLNTGNPKADFNVEKYFNSMSSDIEITEDVVCILYTNSRTYFTEGVALSEQINLKTCDNLENEDLLLNTGEREKSAVFQVTREVADKKQTFYLFTGQNNIHHTKPQVEKMLQGIVQCNIYDSFVHFMTEWWSKNFVLWKGDVVAKLSELALSPYIRTLTGNKRNPKTEFLTEAIMDFRVTIVEETSDNIVEHIWPLETFTNDEFVKTEKKFCLKSYESGKILWYLEKVPLVVKVDVSNETLVDCVLKLLGKTSDNKRVILIGNTSTGFGGNEAFQNLSDLITKSEKKKYCSDILQLFEISLQGREPISLQRFININTELAELVGVSELLTMSQRQYLIGTKRTPLPSLHIPRSVSTIFVKTETILSLCKSQGNQTMAIINCDDKFTRRYRNLAYIETSEYIKREFKDSKHTVLLSTRTKCTRVDFNQICKKKVKTNVYLFQTFDDENCVLLLKQGNEIPDEFVNKRRLIPEDAILRCLDNSLNVICAPAGMGKSRLMDVLCNDCPPDHWGIYINLINHNSFLANKPNLEKMWNYLLKADDNVVKKMLPILRNNQKLYLYFDGLDEVDSSNVNSVLDFVQDASSSGTKIWISSRENLRDRITQSLNVIPIEITELNKSQREEYICEKLKRKYGNEDIKRIMGSILDNVDLNKSQELLGIPLQLHIITEMFLTNDETDNAVQKNVFVLTYMYKLYFEGKVKFAVGKVVDEHQTHQLGSFKVLLKNYEIPALKACLNRKDFVKLGLLSEEMEDFVSEIKRSGDKYGIIEIINDSGDAIFSHQTYAEYFACLWLQRNKEKAAWLQKEMLLERYENLRLMFNIMLAQSNPLHLSVIYRNLDEFEKHVDDIEAKDHGGRTVLHLLCTYGKKYPTDYIKSYWYKTKLVKLNQEFKSYTTMVAKVLQLYSKIHDQDDLFHFDCLSYALEAKCLYPIEAMLEKNLLDFDDVKKTVFGYYKIETLVYYAAHMGYPNLFSALVAQNTQLVHRKVDNYNLLQIAVKGTDDSVTSPREGNIAVVNILLENGFDLTKDGYDTPLGNILEVACDEGKYDMLNILTQKGAKYTGGNTVWHRLAKLGPKSDNTLYILENYKIDVDVNLKNDEGLTALQIAAKFVFFEVVEVLMKRGAEADIVDLHGNNALHFASMLSIDNRTIIKLFIDKGVDVNVQNKNGLTPLHLACKQCNFWNTEVLLEYNAYVDVLDEDNNSALHYASLSTSDKLNITKQLIHKGVNVNVQNRNGTTALQLACEKGNSGIAKMLLENDSDINLVDNECNNALHYVFKSRQNRLHLIKLLIDNGIYVNSQNKNGTSPLQLASRFGDYEAVKELLDCNASIDVVDDVNDNSLHYAAVSWKCNKDVIKLLINRGIDVDAQNGNGTTALHLACENSDYEVAQKLVENHACVKILDDNNNTTLHYMSRSWKNNQNIVRLLIGEGLDINSRNIHGTTALQVACRNCNYHIAEYLLSCDASVNLLDNNYTNALHYASKSEHYNADIIKLLVEKFLSVDSQNRNGTTALQLACQQNNYTNAEKLLQCGACVDLVDDKGNNALHHVAKSRRDSVDVVELLIRAGVDVNARNKNGATALQFACESCNYEIAKKLLECGSLVDVLDECDNDAMDYALRAEYYNEDVIQLLIDAEMDLNV